MEEKKFDIFPKELFLLYDFETEDYTVKYDENSPWDGLFIEASAICAAVITIYSINTNEYLAKIRKCRVESKVNNNEEGIRVILTDFPPLKKEALKKEIIRLNNLSDEQKKTKVLFSTNKPIEDNSFEQEKYNLKDAFLSVENESLENFCFKWDGEFVSKLGTLEDVIDFVVKISRVRKPWKLYKKLLKNKIKE
jgi:hypothetical protein